MLGLKVFVLKQANAGRTKYNVLKQAIADRTSKNDKDAGRISKRHRAGRCEAALKNYGVVALQRPAAHEYSDSREQCSACSLGVALTHPNNLYSSPDPPFGPAITHSAPIVIPAKAGTHCGGCHE